MKVAAIPLNIAWADPDENLHAVENKLSQVSHDTDIVVLPELFSTGYIQDPDVIAQLAEPMSGPTMAAVARWARECNMAIAGSFLCKVGDKLFNRAFFVEPSGEETVYDKRHLFSLSSEHEIFTPGQALPPSVRFRGWNISLIVCYDLRFPVWCRNRRQAYDMMLVPANWPEARAYAWQHLLIARAIENQAVYIGANRSGSDDFGQYDNLTFAFDDCGQPIASIDPDSAIVYAAMDKAKLDNLRVKLPFGKDADDFRLEASALR